MIFDERGLVALVFTWHPLMWLVAMFMASVLTFFATRSVANVPMRYKPLWVAMLYIGVTCALYGTLAEIFHITSIGLDWISLTAHSD